MPANDRDRIQDDEDRFYGHLATYVVVALMAMLLTVPRGLPSSWLVAAFGAWGTLLTAHGFRALARPQPA